MTNTAPSEETSPVPVAELSPTTPPPGDDVDPVARLDAGLIRDLEGSMAPNTWRAYRSDLNDYNDWLFHRPGRWDNPEVIAAYFRHLADNQAAWSTIERRKAAISKLVAIQVVHGHRDPLEDPTRHPRIALAMKAIRRQLSTDQDRARPLTAERLLQVLVAIDPDTLAGTRDIAMLLIGWYGALRVSELARLTPTDLDPDSNGLVLAVAPSKTADHTVWVPIHRQPDSQWDPTTRLTHWLDVLRDRDVDPDVDEDLAPAKGIWRRITRGDTLYQPTTSMTPQAITDLIRRRARQAGLTHIDQYSSHSLRAGFVTTAKDRGLDEGDIMRHTRHKSITVMRTYDRTTGYWNRNPTASLGL